MKPSRAADKPVKVLFIHHSTGANLISQGHLRERLKQLNPSIELWDHSYNLTKYLPGFIAKLIYRTGLSDQNGEMTGIDYDVILSNDSPKEYADIFSRQDKDKTLSSILNYDVIVFKNCFPTTKITSDQQLKQYRNYYQTIIKSIAKYKNKKFIILTPPPLRQELTKKEYAKRAMDLAAWLMSNDQIKANKNIYVFDMFGFLADYNGFLKKEYLPLIPIDSHPNSHANEQLALPFSKFISEVCFNLAG